jgi:threonyl-tRNA synthetase
MNITDDQAEFAENVEKTLKKQGFRVELDLRNEKIGFKIREHTIQRIPYLLVVGNREMEGGAVSVRTQKGEDLGSMTVEAFSELMNTEVSAKSKTVSEG